MENETAIATMETVSVEQVESNVKRMNAVRKIFSQYIKDNLVEGVDYGTITFGGKTSKPSLWKPGGEKMCQLFQLKAEFRRDDETWEMVGKQEGTIFYICELKDRQGSVWGEGRGAAKVGDKSRDINTTIKIAEKRAQIDAVLRVFALSEQFTQDIEDMDTQPVKVVKPIKTPERWEDVVLHFGKNEGKALGELTDNQLRWYINEWQPYPKYAKEADRVLRATLDKVKSELNVYPEDIQPEIIID